MRAAALNNRDLLKADQGDLDAALELAERALDLCSAHGAKNREAAVHSTIADLLHAAGRDPEAIPHLKASASTLSDIGVEKGEYLPEIRQLVEW